MYISPLTANASYDLAHSLTDRVTQAVAGLNANQFFGDGNEIILARDESRRLVVQVVNRDTRAIITQLPVASIFQLLNKRAQ